MSILLPDVSENLPGSIDYWLVVTHMGTFGLMLPVLAMSSLSLLRSGQAPVVRTWLLALTVAALVVLATKIAFLGWGLGIPALDFTGISGHSMLAAAILPVLFSLPAYGGNSRYGLIIGLGLSGFVAYSRVVLGAHSPSEALSGFALGMAVSIAAWHKLNVPARASYFTGGAVLCLLLSFNTQASNYVPTHDLEVGLALMISGRSAPYVRAHPVRSVTFAKNDSAHISLPD